MSEHLSRWGYDVYQTENFQNIIKNVIHLSPNLILLDISLPFYNGFHWCAEIRKISQVPIIFISSANDNMNMVMSMNMGGDDFIAKPFDLDVLTAKVQALLRRTYSFNQIQDILEHQGVLLNLNDMIISYDNNNMELTKNEYRIIQTLMEHVGEIVSREMLIERLWNSDCFIDDNTLTVNVNRLRKKLTKLGLNDYIKTKKGLGYVID